MSTFNSKNKTNRLAEYVALEKAKLIIPEKVKKQIDFLHQKVGGIEWCGILLYKVLKGNISAPENMVVKVEDIFLMDIGSSAYTSADVSSDDQIDMLDNYDLDTLRQGLIH